MMMPSGPRAMSSALDRAQLRRAVRDAFAKLDPRLLRRNPVMFTVLAGAVLSTVALVPAIVSGSEVAFTLQITLWLWFTLLFANFAEALAEGRGKAQADALRATRTTTQAKRLAPSNDAMTMTDFEIVPATSLQRGDVILCLPGDVIAADGEVIEGAATVDESAVTGESAPVVRESGGDRSAVTAGTRVLSDHIVVRVTAGAGETFIDRMIGLVENATRRKTPNEIALGSLLAGLSLVFLLVCTTLPVFAAYFGVTLSIPVLVALLVCLIPTTIGGLLPAIGIAGMDRLIRRNVIAMSGRAVEAAGDVDTLLLDKTGTITLGDRAATAFVPAAGLDEYQLAHRAALASAADETPEGRSIVALAGSRHGVSVATVGDGVLSVVPFTAQTRMSGVDGPGFSIRKGAVDAVRRWVEEEGGEVDRRTEDVVTRIARDGGTPLLVAERAAGVGRVLGVVQLRDIVKAGLTERFTRLRAMGIRTVMITGDNPLTAAAIAREAGVDDYLAEATPEDKLALIRREQAGGRLVAMTGDGTNDAPALAQADVGVAMNTGTQAAREAANMVDLDSDPTKLIEIVETGKQLLMTRGSLTTFSVANDVAKYFAIVPALFVAADPNMAALNVMGLTSPQSAILSSVIFNAIIIIALVPLALRGVAYRPAPVPAILRRNLLVYGVGGLVAPFLGIKLIDVALVGLHLI